MHGDVVAVCDGDVFELDAHPREAPPWAARGARFSASRRPVLGVRRQVLGCWPPQLLPPPDERRVVASQQRESNGLAAALVVRRGGRLGGDVLARKRAEELGGELTVRICVQHGRARGRGRGELATDRFVVAPVVADVREQHEVEGAGHGPPCPIELLDCRRDPATGLVVCVPASERQRVGLSIDEADRGAERRRDDARQPDAAAEVEHPKPREVPSAHQLPCERDGRRPDADPVWRLLATHDPGRPRAFPQPGAVVGEHHREHAAPHRGRGAAAAGIASGPAPRARRARRAFARAHSSRCKVGRARAAANENSLVILDDEAVARSRGLEE